MAQTKTKEVSTQAPDISKIKEFYEQNKDRVERYASAQEALRALTDVNKGRIRNIPIYTREDLRNALKNLSSNQARLRDISWYLYYRVSLYWRIVNFYANQIDLNTRSVIPDYDPTKKTDKEQTLSNYYKTLKLLDSVDWNYEFFNVLLTAWIQDVSYNCVWWENDQFFILPLPIDEKKKRYQVSDTENEGTLFFVAEDEIFMKLT